ncbi:MGMT family protein [Lachnospiraceae bacterium OttesenSCG-928-D06]|nr:MGMT family protein [Lachnospiraceae bacterium OttesenSCG-928-D06]
MDFYKRMEIIGANIPYGKVATYGQIALLCGYPKNSRQVGYGLRADKVASCFPAHRIVNGKGFLSGAAAFPIQGMQQRMLLQEGVAVKDNQVDLKKYQWCLSWEEVQKFQDLFENSSGLV